MRNWSVGLAVALIVVLVAASAEAISSGPGGRVYTTSRGTATADCITLTSILIAANWDNGGMTSHGTINDGWTYGRHAYYGISPEVENPGQAPGYANLVMGVFYDNTPGSAFAAPAQTMDVVRIAPANGSNSVTLLGDGRASTLGTTWYPGSQRRYHTDRGEFAAPDPAGLFTGASNRYITTQADYRRALNINYDNDGSGDITDVDADTWAQTSGDSGAVGGYSGYANDFEIVGNRMYTNDSYAGNYGGGEDVSSIRYYQSNPATKALSSKLFYVSQGLQGPFRGGPVAIHFTNTGIAAAKLSGIDTVWTYGVDNNNLLNGVKGIYMFQDLNGDGDAMDNAAVTGSRNEWTRIFDANSAAGVWNDPTDANILDLELVTNADNDMFLLVLDGNTVGGTIGRHLWVMALADNGVYLGGDSNVKLIATTQEGITLGTEIEFDPTSAVIPEPATLLLLGSGVLSAAGWLRRRRMR